MRLRKLTFPIAIRYPNELEGGRKSGLGNLARFDWALSAPCHAGRFDNIEIIDSSGRAYRVVKIFLMRPTVWRWFLDRLGHLLILPRLEKREIVRVDMELEDVRHLTLEQFKEEYRELILSHPAWWKRYYDRNAIEGMFRSATSFADAFNEIGILAPADDMNYRGTSTKVIDLR